MENMERKLQRSGLKCSSNPEDASADSLFPDTERIPQLGSYLPSNQASASVAHIVSHETGFQDANMITIKVKIFDTNTYIKFELSMSSGLAELQQQVAKRLNLEAGTYNISYKGEDGKFTLIACEKDFQDCMQTSISLGKTAIYFGVSLFPDTERIPQLGSYLPSNQASAFQDANMINVKVKFDTNAYLKLGLSMSSGLAELQQEVAEWLAVAGTYNIRCEGEDGKLILLACDEDLQDCMQTSKSLGKTAIVVFLELK